MSEVSGHPVTLIHEDGERVILGFVKSIEERPGGVRIIRMECPPGHDIPNIIPAATKIEIEDFGKRRYI